MTAAHPAAPMPRIFDTTGADLVLAVGELGYRLHAPELSPALAAYTLRTIAKTIHPGKARLAREIRGELWDVFTEMMEALELTKGEPGPLRTSVDDMRTATAHLRKVIETL